MGSTRSYRDGTILERDVRKAARGGWSRRATLFGGDHTAGATPRCSIAARAARVRAMYTDPAHVRRGIGQHVLDAAKRCARGGLPAWSSAARSPASRSTAPAAIE